MTDLTPEQRQRLRELSDAATPGEWVAVGRTIGASVNHCTCAGGGPVPHEYGCGLEGPLITDASTEDAEFVAAARSAVPALLDMLDAAEAKAKTQADLAFDRSLHVDLGEKAGDWGIIPLAEILAALNYPKNGDVALERIEKWEAMEVRLDAVREITDSVKDGVALAESDGEAVARAQGYMNCAERVRAALDGEQVQP